MRRLLPKRAAIASFLEAAVAVLAAVSRRSQGIVAIVITSFALGALFESPAVGLAAAGVLLFCDYAATAWRRERR